MIQAHVHVCEPTDKANSISVQLQEFLNSKFPCSQLSAMGRMMHHENVATDFVRAFSNNNAKTYLTHKPESLF